MTVLKISKLQRFILKTKSAWLGGKSLFSYKCKFLNTNFIQIQISQYKFLIQLSATITIAALEIYSWKLSGNPTLQRSFDLRRQNVSKVNRSCVDRKLIMWSSHAKSLYLISNPPPCPPYNSYDLSWENLVLDQLVIC